MRGDKMDEFKPIEVAGRWAVAKLPSGEIQSVNETLHAAIYSVDVDYWFVGDAFVLEPSLGGKTLGEGFDVMAPRSRVLRIGRDLFEIAVEEFNAENGHYPDA